MSSINIRPARLTDLPTLIQFEQGVIEAERPFDVTLKGEKIHYYDIEELITAPHIQFLVAESEGQLIGSGYARIKQVTASKYKHQRFAYLGFMYVLPTFRGLGVNGLIIQRLKEWCTLQGITELQLEVYNDNPAAVKAYQKVGFSKLMVSMRMSLED